MSFPKAPIKPFRIHKTIRSLQDKTADLGKMEGTKLKRSSKGLENKKISSIHSKLYAQIEKIEQWKINKEQEIEGLEHNLAEANRIIETQKKSLFELKLEKENLTNMIKEEDAQHKAAINKLDGIRKLCETLKRHTDSVEHKIHNIAIHNQTFESFLNEKLDMFNNFKLRIQTLQEKYDVEINFLTNTLTKEQATTLSLNQAYNKTLCNANNELQTLKSIIIIKENSAKNALESIDHSKIAFNKQINVKEGLEIDLQNSENECANYNMINTNLCCEINTKVQNRNNFEKLLKNNYTVQIKFKKDFESIKEALFAGLELLKNKYSEMQGDTVYLEGKVDEHKVYLDELDTKIKDLQCNNEQLDTFKVTIEEVISNADQQDKNLKTLKSQLYQSLLGMKQDIFLTNEFYKSNKHIFKENELLANATSLLRCKSNELSESSKILKEKNEANAARITVLQAECSDINDKINKASNRKIELEESITFLNDLIKKLSQEVENDRQANSTMKLHLEENMNSLNKLEKNIELQSKILDSQEKDIKAKQDIVDFYLEKEKAFQITEKELKLLSIKQEKLIKENKDLEQNYNECLNKYESLIQENKACSNNINISQLELRKSKLSENKSITFVEESKKLYSFQMRELKQILENTQSDYQKALSSKDNEIDELKRAIEKEQSICDKHTIKMFDQKKYGDLEAHNQKVYLHNNELDSNQFTDLKAELASAQENYYKSLSHKDTEIQKLQNAILALQENLKEKNTNENFNISSNYPNSPMDKTPPKLFTEMQSKSIKINKKQESKKNPKFFKRKSHAIYEPYSFSKDNQNQEPYDVDENSLEKSPKNIKKSIKEKKNIFFRNKRQAMKKKKLDNFESNGKTSHPSHIKKTIETTSKKYIKTLTTISPEQKSEGFGWFDL